MLVRLASNSLLQPLSLSLEFLDSHAGKARDNVTNERQSRTAEQASLIEIKSVLIKSQKKSRARGKKQFATKIELSDATQTQRKEV